MLLTLKEYQKKYYPDKSISTVQRMVRGSNLPSSHYVKKSQGKRGETIIFIGSEHEYKAAEYYDACCEFHKIKSKFTGSMIELCVELSIKYDIGLTKLTKILGV